MPKWQMTSTQIRWLTTDHSLFYTYSYSYSHPSLAGCDCLWTVMVSNRMDLSFIDLLTTFLLLTR